MPLYMWGILFMPKKKNAARKDGRIAVQVYLGLDENKKRKYKTVYGATQKEAEAKALQLKLSMRKGLDIAAERDTFGDWAERWIGIKATEVSRSQAANYNSTVKHINDGIKNMPIKKVKPIDLQEIIKALAKRNPNTKKPDSKRLLTEAKNTINCEPLSRQNEIKERVAQKIIKRRGLK